MCFKYLNQSLNVHNNNGLKIDEQYKAKVERMIHLKKGKKIEKEMSFVEYHI